MTSIMGTATLAWKNVFECSNFGYNRTKNAHLDTWEDLDNKTLFDLHGKTFLVTGSNSGIGYNSAYYFADHGATVHILCRNPERGQKAISEIKAGTGNNNVFLHTINLAEPKEVRQFAEQFIAEGNSLDVLVNNASSFGKSKDIEYNSQGVEKTLATNTLGPFLLTNLLIPLLKKSPEPRVISTSSIGALAQHLVIRDDYMNMFMGYSPMSAYSRTKRHTVVLTELWNEKFGDSGITFSAMHPGVVDTKMVKESLKSLKILMGPLLRDKQQGADTIKWLAVSKQAVGPQVSGNWYRDRQIERKHAPLASTPYTQEEMDNLWNWCSELTGNPSA